MKVYSNTLTTDDLLDAGDTPGAGRVVSLSPMRRPQLRARGWRVELGGGNRWKNTGTHGADSSERAATWDQHGWWMAEVYKRDPEALIVAARRYDGAEDFHEQTKEVYTSTSRPCIGCAGKGRRRAGSRLVPWNQGSDYCDECLRVSAGEPARGGGGWGKRA